MTPDRPGDTGEFPATAPASPLVPRPGPPTDAVTVDWAAASHPGRVRPANEDHYLLARAGRYLRTEATSLPAGCVPGEFGDVVYAVGVADGMGGEAAGEVASRRALTVLVQLVLATPDWIFRLGEGEVGEVVDRAARRFRAVNEAVVDEAGRGRHLAGMGTTLTVAWSLGPDLFVAHVGDSRAYLLRGGGLRRLTRDHTLAEEVVAAGGMTPGEAATHRLRHVLTRVIGRRGKGDPDVQRFRLGDGDRLLVCTDGLTEMVDEAAVGGELARDAPAADICRGLIDLALAAGGKDNVTAAVAVYRIPSGM